MGPMRSRCIIAGTRSTAANCGWSRIAKIADIDDLYCETPSGIVFGIPHWMTDPGRCATMEIADPVIGLGALAELRRLLDGLKSP